MSQTDFRAQLSRILDKTRLVLLRNEALAKEVKALKEERDSLRSELLAREGENEKLKLELEYLRVASVVSPTAEGRKQTADMLSDLVRELDRCIADLRS